MSEKSVKFHIESDDYFGTVASILSLLRENLNNKIFLQNNIKILNNLEHDLMFLQKEYKIAKKEKI